MLGPEIRIGNRTNFATTKTTTTRITTRCIVRLGSRPIMILQSNDGDSTGASVIVSIPSDLNKLRNHKDNNYKNHDALHRSPGIPANNDSPEQRWRFHRRLCHRFHTYILLITLYSSFSFANLGFLHKYRVDRK